MHKNIKIIQMLSLSFFVTFINAVPFDYENFYNKLTNLSFGSKQQAIIIRNLKELVDDKSCLTLNLKSIKNPSKIDALLKIIIESGNSAILKKIKAIDLSDNDLKTVPPTLFYFHSLSHVKCIDFSNNKIEQYPQTFITIFLHLETLKLQKNKIPSIEIPKHYKLSTIYIDKRTQVDSRNENLIIVFCNDK